MHLPPQNYCEAESVLCKPIGSPCYTELAAQRDVMALAFDFQGLQFKEGTDRQECRVALRRDAAFFGSGPWQLASAAPGIITLLSVLILIYDNVDVDACRLRFPQKKFGIISAPLVSATGGISQLRNAWAFHWWERIPACGKRRKSGRKSDVTARELTAGDRYCA